MGLSWISDDIDPASVPGTLPHPKREPRAGSPPAPAPASARPGRRPSHRASRPQPAVLLAAARIATLAGTRLIADPLSGAPPRPGSFRRYWA
jgi:hypothetical protein